jgi:hypothetical protein
MLLNWRPLRPALPFQRESRSSHALNIVLAAAYQRGMTRVHWGTRTLVRSERYSEVHGKCNSVSRRRAYRPTETDWQVCLDEVSFEQAVVMLDGPAFINQGRKSHRGVIYDERRS